MARSAWFTAAHSLSQSFERMPSFRDSIQAFDMSCPNNEMDHLYVATNAVR